MAERVKRMAKAWSKIYKNTAVTFLTVALFCLGGCGDVTLEEEQPVTLTWYINFSWFDKSWGNDAVSQYITEKTGIDVEYVIPTGDPASHIQNFLANGITADIITLDSWDNSYITFQQNDMLAPIDVLNKEYDCNFFENIQHDTINWYKYNNHIYVCPNASYQLGAVQGYSNQTFLVREDIYNAIGRPNMSTPEGFLQALSDAVDFCPEVDGKPLIPLGLYEFTSNGNVSLEDYLQNFLAIPYEEDGVVVDRFLHSDYLIWLKTINTAYQQGLMADDVFLDRRVQMEEKIVDSRYFAMLYQWSDCLEQLQIIDNSKPSQNYIAVDGPKNVAGDDHTLAGSSVQGWTVTGISSDSPNQEAAIKLLSFLASDEGQRLIFLGVEGHGYISDENDFKATEPALELMLTNQTEYANVFGGLATHWPMMNNHYSDTMGYVMFEGETFGHIKDWSAQYVENFSLYAYQDSLYDSTAYVAKLQDDVRKGSLFIDLILATSDQEFYDIWDMYLVEREEYNFDAVLEARQAQLEYNKMRLE